MHTQKYSAQQHLIETLNIRVKSSEINKCHQIANYVYMQQEVNISVGNKAPQDYFSEILEQCKGGDLKYGGIASLDELNTNLASNCVPSSIFTMTVDHYDEFLKQRRQLMANKMKDYYWGL